MGGRGRCVGGRGRCVGGRGRCEVRWSKRSCSPFIQTSSRLCSFVMVTSLLITLALISGSVSPANAHT